MRYRCVLLRLRLIVAVAAGEVPYLGNLLRFLFFNSHSIRLLNSKIFERLIKQFIQSAVSFYLAPALYESVLQELSGRWALFWTILQTLFDEFANRLSMFAARDEFFSRIELFLSNELYYAHEALISVR